MYFSLYFIALLLYSFLQFLSRITFLQPELLLIFLYCRCVGVKFSNISLILNSLYLAFDFEIYFHNLYHSRLAVLLFQLFRDDNPLSSAFHIACCKAGHQVYYCYFFPLFSVVFEQQKFDKFCFLFFFI